MIRGALFLIFASLCSVHARTIVFTDLDADKMAALDANAPEFGWAGHEQNPTIFHSLHVGTSIGRAFLMRFPLDRLPKGQRIVNAELVIPVRQTPRVGVPLCVWRLTADWGAGVCHLFRQTQPQKVEWSIPGARGNGVDRALEPTSVTAMKVGYHELVVNVTKDIELWYGGATPNYGWLLTNEEADVQVFFDSPTANGRERWRLRITYEPQ